LSEKNGGEIILTHTVCISHLTVPLISSSADSSNNDCGNGTDGTVISVWL